MVPRKRRRKQSDWHALSTDHWQSDDGFNLEFSAHLSSWGITDAYGNVVAEQKQLFPALGGAPLQWANEELAKAGF